MYSQNYHRMIQNCLPEIEKDFPGCYAYMILENIPDADKYILDESTINELISVTSYMVNESLPQPVLVREMSSKAYKSELKGFWGHSPEEELAERLKNQYLEETIKKAQGCAHHVNGNFSFEINRAKKIIGRYNHRMDSTIKQMSIEYLDNIKEHQVSKNPPSSYQFLRSDTIGELFHELTVDTYVNKNNRNDLISLYQHLWDPTGGFCWAVPVVTEDKYTGEQIINVSVHPKVINSGEINVLPSIHLSFGMDNNIGYYFLYTNSEGLSGYTNSYEKVTFSEWENGSLIANALNIISRKYQKKPKAQSANFTEIAKSHLRNSIIWQGAYDWLSPKFIDNSTLCWFVSSDSPRYGYVFNKGKNTPSRLFVEYGDNGAGHFELRSDDKIKSIETNERTITIEMENGEKFVGLRGSLEFFSGTLTRPGYTINFQRDFKSELIFTADTKVKLTNDDETIIPKGSKYVGGIWYKGLKEHSAYNTLVCDQNDNIYGDIYDPNGEKLMHVRRIGFTWSNWDKINAQRKVAEEKESAQKEAAKQAIINAYSQKYGKQYVEAAVKGKVIVGMPEKLLKEVFEYVLESTSTYSSTYRVFLDAPLFNLTNNTLSKQTLHFNFTNSKALVTVVRGKVTSVTYY